MVDRRTFLKLLAGAAVAPAARGIGASAARSFWRKRWPPNGWHSQFARSEAKPK